MQTPPATFDGSIHAQLQEAVDIQQGGLSESYDTSRAIQTSFQKLFCEIKHMMCAAFVVGDADLA